MGFISFEKILGYNLPGIGLICVSCFEKNHADEKIEQEHIITEDTLDQESGLTFCDECGEEIIA